jgi:hypothetical protein
MPEKLIKDLVGIVEEVQPETEAASASASTRTCQKSSYSTTSAAHVPSLPNMLYDITTADGREGWFANNKTSSITEKRMGSG